MTAFDNAIQIRRVAPSRVRAARMFRREVFDLAERMRELSSDYQRGTMRENAMSTAEIIETKGTVVRRFALSLIWVLLAFSSAASGPQQDAGSIRGAVVDENNVAVGTSRANAEPIEGRFRASAIRELQVATPATSPLDVSTPDFTLDDQPILTGVQMLNREGLGIDLGFEEILTRKVSDPEVPAVKITVRLLKPTIPEILNALCAADPRYTWSIDGLTVNVFPSSTMTDSKYLLNRELASFRVNGITEMDQGLLGIAQQLPGPMEQIAHSQVGGDSSYPIEPWTAAFENLTVRQAINRLVEHMGGSSSWFFGGSDEFRYFAFYRGRFHPSR